jgi:opacity protein-like surface antigen
MKRIILSLATALLVSPMAAQAQIAESPLFSKGTKLLSVNIQTGGDYDATGFGGAFELGVAPIGKSATFGLGASIGYFSESARFFTESYTISLMPIMATGNVHFGLKDVKNLGLYAGASLGIIRASVDYEGAFDEEEFGIGASDSESGFGLQVGARYAITPKLLLHGQLGLIDIPLLTAGVSIKF